MKILLIGCGPMSSDYFKVLEHLKIETDIIGKYIERLLKFENKNYDLNTYRKLKR